MFRHGPTPGQRQKTARAKTSSAVLPVRAALAISADASAQIFFLVTGEPTSTKSWTESKDLSNGTVVTTHENVVYVSEGGAVK